MKVRPITRYTRPRYPTQSVLDAQPELLRVLPGRWRRNALIAAGLTSCCSLLLLQAERASTSPLARLAPLFQHGGGDTRGVIGTSFSTGPVFLPEDEARQVIANELLKSGVSVAPDKPVITGLSIPTVDPKTKKPRKVKASLTMDGENAKRHIAYEYLTPEDCEKLGFPKNGNLKQQGEALRTALGNSTAAGTLAVFYDPCVMYTDGDFRHDRDVPGMVPCSNFTDATLVPLALFRESAENESAIVIKKNDITISLNGHKVRITVGSDRAEFDGKAATLPCPVSKLGETPYLPLRPVAQALGFKVKWDAKKETVSTTMPGRMMPMPPWNSDDNDEKEEQYYEESRTYRRGSANPKTTPTYAFLYLDNDGVLALIKEKSKAELRLQVRDFLAWLKAERVI